MSFSRRILLGLALGIAAGLFFGEAIAPLKIAADGFVRLLQMTVLPYVTLSITANLGALTYAQARTLGLHTSVVLIAIWLSAILFACLLPLSFPEIETAAFYSPAMAQAAGSFDFLDLYVPSNPFSSLANGVVPAVVLFSVLLGLAIIGVENKKPLLDVLQSAAAAVARVSRFVVRLMPIGVFAIAANVAGTLQMEQVQRMEVYLVSYVVFALLLALWVLPGLVSVLTPVGGREALAASHDALLTAFLVGDLFIVLPSLMDACSRLIETRIDPAAGSLPSSIIPTSFTFPHAGKLLSLSFVLFAGWYSDAVVPLLEYPALALTGFFAFFGSMNTAVPFLLDLFRIPADTFQLFIATGVINSRFGTLLAAVHTLAVGLLGSAAIAGRLRIQPFGLVRFVATTGVLTVLVIVSLRAGFASFVETSVNGLAVVSSMQPMATPPVNDRLVLGREDVSESTIPEPGRMLASIRERGVLRVGVIVGSVPFAFSNDKGQLVGLDVEMASQLARDIGVEPQFVRFADSDLADIVDRRIVDIVMTGARVTPERAEAYQTSDPYMDETLAIVTEDHRRRSFQSWEVIRAMGPVRIGVQNLPYYVGTIRALLPDANVSVLGETAELFNPGAPYDAYVLAAERGSVLTMLDPRLSVVIPSGVTIRMPLAYPIAGADPSWLRFVNTWIALKRRDGFIDRLYDHWILGRAATPPRRRWSVMHDVLGWD